MSGFVVVYFMISCFLSILYIIGSHEKKISMSKIIALVMGSPILLIIGLFMTTGSNKRKGGE